MNDEAKAILFISIICILIGSGFSPRKRTDCATLCVNGACVQTCPATTMSFTQ